MLFSARDSLEKRDIESAAAELLRGPNINLLGTVLNKVRLSKRHRDHYYYDTSTRRTKPQ